MWSQPQRSSSYHSVPGYVWRKRNVKLSQWMMTWTACLVHPDVKTILKEGQVRYSCLSHNCVSRLTDSKITCGRRKGRNRYKRRWKEMTLQKTQTFWEPHVTWIKAESIKNTTYFTSNTTESNARGMKIKPHTENQTFYQLYYWSECKGNSDNTENWAFCQSSWRSKCKGNWDQTPHKESKIQPATLQINKWVRLNSEILLVWMQGKFRSTLTQETLNQQHNRSKQLFPSQNIKK